MTEPSDKLKAAFYWCASCGGCEEAVIDLAENIFDVLKVADIVFWPAAMDNKKEYVETLPDSFIDVTFVNGAVRLSEQEDMVKLLRKKSKIIVAFGSCAHLGGVPGLANLSNKNEIFERVYKDASTLEGSNNIFPLEEFPTKEGKLELPSFYNTVRTIDQVIEVDYYTPGCAPPPQVVKITIDALFGQTRPPKGTVFASQKALCDECSLNETKPEELVLKEIRRPHETMLDSDKCYLVQSVLCMGPATRGGCDALCIKGNMPCTGCFGPLDNAMDYGARALSFVASILGCKDEESIHRTLENMIDPVGLFYRYSLPKSSLRRRNMGK